MSPNKPIYPEGLEIALLADHPEAIPAIATGYEAEWDFWYGLGGKGCARSDLLERAQSDHLPLGLIALISGKPIGATALAANAISLHPEMTPCLIGLWVEPSYRHCGVGTALLSASNAMAAQLGFDHVYATTTTAPGLFVHAGWKEIERTLFKEEELWIYSIESK